MTISSNTYADKIYSENPIALWALDEEIPDTISGTFSLPFNGPIANVPYLYTGAEAKAYKYGSTTDSDYGYYSYLPYAISEQSAFWQQYSNNILNHENINVDTLYTRVSSDSVPLVYGSANVAEMYPSMIPGISNRLPSILIPGKGFLNESAKFADMTLEFWIKAINFSSFYEPTRIAGPVASDDGLYLHKKSLILKIGNVFCSGFVNGFNKPMLVDISISATSASILVNGEIIASMVIDMSKISLPDAYSNGFEQDWIAFSALNSHSINLDCIAIYNYCVPDIVAKKRFAYGQAVEHPQSVLAKHGGQAYVVDGAFANFSKTIKYPQTNSWQSGTISNLIVSDNKLKFPDYSLPEFYAIDSNGNSISQTWIDKDINPLSYDTWHGFDFYPGIEFSSNKAQYSNQYIAFNGLPVKSSKLHSFMIQMKNSEVFNKDTTSDKILFKLLDKASQDYFIGKLHFQAEAVGSISAGVYLKTYFVKSNTSIYSYSSEALDSTHGYIYSNFDSSKGDYGLLLEEYSVERHSIGIDISYIKENNPESFLNGNSDNWILYIGGDNSGLNTYTGYISKVMFVDTDIADYLPNPAQNISRFQNGKYFGDCTETVTYALVFNYIGSYFYPDIELCGYWIHNIPFSRLASNVNGAKTLDIIQINTFNNESSPANNSYKVSSSISDVATNDLSNLLSRYAPSIGDSTVLVSTKDPLDETFADQYVNITLLLKTDGVFTENPYITKLQASSRINNSSQPIGSKFGISAYSFGPENKKNVYSISMDSTPYNYLTDISGISLLGQSLKSPTDGSWSSQVAFDQNCDTGIRIPINYNNSNDFYIQSLQFYYRPIDSTTSSMSALGFGYDFNLNAYWYPLFDIYSQTSYIPNGYAQSIPMNHLRIKAIRVSDRIVKLICVNILDGIETDITEHIKFTINGHLNTSNSIEIESIEWSVIGILFPTPLNMSGQGYSIDILGPGVFNNIVYLKIPKDDLFSRIVTNTWEQVYTSHTWQNILSLNTNWQDAYLDQVPAIYTITPEYLYNLYQGTNRIVVASSPQKPDIAINSIGSTVYKNVLWLSENIKPV